MQTPLIDLRAIRKSYGGGDSPQVNVLQGIDLSIHAGEFVAIVGASGSGKSTLMNILGCLDRPTSGEYLFAGENVAALGSDELAWLRREAFGFVFQGYHLIPSGSAQENVEMPAIYAGTPAAQRHARAAALLDRLGLASRTGNRPHQLSGGQQQRVSIARALMNGGHIILADEPTGALDSHSGAEVMTLLDELASQGHVVILITHDRDVAARARRVIEISDGRILSDTARDRQDEARCTVNPAALQAVDLRARLSQGSQARGAWKGELLDAIQAAWRVMWINRFRTALTLLGIVIGVASVVVMLAVGEGSKRQVMAQMSSFGSNIIYLNGKAPNPRAPKGIIALEEVAALGDLPEVRMIMPVNGGQAGVRFGNVDHSSYVGGNDTHFPAIFNWPVVEGSYFTEADEQSAAAVAVIGYKVRQKLFGDRIDPIGQYILIENVPFQVVGVLQEKGASSGDLDSDNRIAIPYSSASIRLFGTQNPEYITIATRDADNVKQAEAAIRTLLDRLHNGKQDYELTNNAAMIQAEARTQNTLSLMLGSIAAISLLVGGIGVMNIMLMTVRERTREIGIRMATGARQSDILRQFLTEAVMLSVVGGLTGIVLALGMGAVLLLSKVAVAFSVSAVAGAFGCALITGVIFGFMPARKAARLDPVAALTSQ
ncbi:macrolide ABC transporter permease/ATP-binding protein MacB [Pseudomonas floridensis]|uniref:Pyoverdine export ATP-binding/permease protein PvdT n=1 Tax=Pseudomonas floridensis TaxID=1958950 RepID=A0A1X0N5J3_9PSED|nr:MacB family efflux pump subunit [Pseudomonas floridensis]ORC58607.1 macrolide ABC transporter permease/ATP-binding protein MacB [Pseudomonas floridensis]